MFCVAYGALYAELIYTGLTERDFDRHGAIVRLRHALLELLIVVDIALTHEKYLFPLCLNFLQLLMVLVGVGGELLLLGRPDIAHHLTKERKELVRRDDMPQQLLEIVLHDLFLNPFPFQRTGPIIAVVIWVFLAAPALGRASCESLLAIGAGEDAAQWENRVMAVMLQF